MKTLIITALSLSMLLSCGTKVDPSDKTKPTLEIVSTTPAFKVEGDEKLIELKKGESFTTKLKIMDNSELKELKFDIHSAEGHTHARMEGSKWATSKVVNIAGKEQTLSESFTVPADAEVGEYHCAMSILDANGNESIEYVLALDVK